MVEYILNKMPTYQRGNTNLKELSGAFIMKVAGIENLESPSLYDEVIKLLKRRDFDISAECLKRDWSKAYQVNSSVEKAWLKIYKNPSPENDLYLFGEILIELADMFSQYRFKHLTTVERILGSKPGTGGSSGVGWLRNTIDHRFFPELWIIRTKL